jgi:peptide deformylase
MYKKFLTVINPVILESSEETCEAWEGCISNDDDIALVKRPKMVRVKYTTVNGKEVELQCDGLISRIFQHEIDHLDGKAMEEQAS